MSLYDSSLPQFTKMLRNMERWLDKAEAHAEAKKYDVNVLLHARLAPDQFALVRQIQAACDQAKAGAAHLAGLTVRVTKKVGENETLYGSVTSQEIADQLKAQGVEIDRRKIQLKEPIKTLGTFEVPVKIHRNVAGAVSVQVVAESAE